MLARSECPAAHRVCNFAWGLLVRHAERPRTDFAGGHRGTEDCSQSDQHPRFRSPVLRFATLHLEHHERWRRHSSLGGHDQDQLDHTDSHFRCCPVECGGLHKYEGAPRRDHSGQHHRVCRRGIQQPSDGDCDALSKGDYGQALSSVGLSYSTPLAG